MGAAVLSDKKPLFSQTMFPGRWPTYVSYERSNTFFKSSSEVSFQDCKGESITVWHDVHTRFKAEVAASQMGASMFEPVLKVAYDALRVLKSDHPECISEVIMLTMPRSGDAPLGYLLAPPRCVVAHCTEPK